MTEKPLLPRTAQQHNQEAGIASTGKELPSIPDTLRRITEIRKTQEALLKKLADVELAIAQARQDTAREFMKTIETMYPELRQVYWQGKGWQDLKEKYGHL